MFWGPGRLSQQARLFGAKWLGFANYLSRLARVSAVSKFLSFEVPNVREFRNLWSVCTSEVSEVGRDRRRDAGRLRSGFFNPLRLAAEFAGPRAAWPPRTPFCARSIGNGQLPELTGRPFFTGARMAVRMEHIR